MSLVHHPRYVLFGVSCAQLAFIGTLAVSNFAPQYQGTLLLDGATVSVDALAHRVPLLSARASFRDYRAVDTPALTTLCQMHLHHFCHALFLHLAS